MIRRSDRCNRVILITVALSAASMAGCSPREASVDMDADWDRVSVLLVTLDTTRADRLGCYGYANADTPTFDRLAQNGVLFKQCYSPVPITLPAHASLMTGVYPQTHGVRDNGRAGLGEALPTLAESFNAHGYATAAFIASRVLDRRFGLARGFDAYFDGVGALAPGQPAVLAQRPANSVTDDALAWLERQGDLPFFAWVHYYDPHLPYAPPPGTIPSGGDAYDGEVTFCDRQLTRILDQLALTGRMDDTLVVVTADHGESFGEHREEGHQLFLYETNLHVPMIWHQPKRLPAKTQVHTIVRLVDVMPTMLKLFKWDRPTVLVGEDLTAAIFAQAATQPSAYAESFAAFNKYGWSKQKSLTTPTWKYIDTTLPELFDRTADPGEMHNIAGQRAEISAELLGNIQALERSWPVGEPAAVQLSARDQAMLAALGYLGGPSHRIDPSVSDAPLPDPKLLYDVILQAKRARVLLRQGKYREVVTVGEAALQRAPTAYDLRFTLGQAYAQLKDWEAARHHLQAFVAVSPSSAPAQTTLGTALRQLGQRQQALSALEQAVQNDPDYVEARLQLGIVLIDLGQTDEGLLLLEQTVEEFPRHQRSRKILNAMRRRVDRAGQ